MAEDLNSLDDLSQKRRELFADRALVERIDGQVELRLHRPTPCETVLVYDAPWEGNATTYHCVFKDGDR